jgi:hypothetical protein
VLLTFEECKLFRGTRVGGHSGVSVTYVSGIDPKRAYRRRHQTLWSAIFGQAVFFIGRIFGVPRRSRFRSACHRS